MLPEDDKYAIDNLFFAFYVVWDYPGPGSL